MTTKRDVTIILIKSKYISPQKSLLCRMEYYSFVFLVLFLSINIWTNIWKLITNETKCDKAGKKHTIIKVLGITTLALLILISTAGATQSTNVWFHKGSELMSSEKYNEAIKASDKAIKFDLQVYNSLA